MSTTRWPDAMLALRMDAKKALRRRLLQARAALTRERLEAAHARLLPRVQAMIEARRPATVAAYHPFGTEPGGAALPGLVTGLAPRVLFPVLLPDLDLDWELAGAPQGVHAITSADLIIVPALAVDLDGYRLGRGGGSYDRALARVTPAAMIVALLHDGELLDHVPHEPHDHRVHVALTPSGAQGLDI